MPYRIRPFQENQNQGQQQKSSGTGAALQSEGGSGGGGGTAGSRPASSGQFQNLIGFLNANQEQGQNLNQAISSNVGEKVSGFQGSLNQAKSDFEQDVERNTVKYDQGAVDKAIQGDTADAADKLNARYTGPTSFVDSSYAQPLQQQAATIKSLGDLGKTSGGREELIKDTFAEQPKKATTTGHKYDNVLLTKAPGWDNTLQALNQASTATDTLGSTAQELATKAQGARTASQAAREQTKQGLISGAQGIFDTLRERARGLNENQQGEFDALRQAFMDAYDGKGQISDAQLATLGLNREQFNNLVAEREEGVNLGDFVNFTPGQYGEGDVATDEEIARYNALRALVGGEGGLSTGLVAQHGFDYDRARDLLRQQGDARRSAEQAEADRLAAEEAARRQAEEDARRQAEELANQQSGYPDSAWMNDPRVQEMWNNLQAARTAGLDEETYNLLAYNLMMYGDWSPPIDYASLYPTSTTATPTVTGVRTDYVGPVKPSQAAQEAEDYYQRTGRLPSGVKRDSNGMLYRLESYGKGQTRKVYL